MGLEGLRERLRGVGFDTIVVAMRRFYRSSGGMKNESTLCRTFLLE